MPRPQLERSMAPVGLTAMAVAGLTPHGALLHPPRARAQRAKIPGADQVELRLRPSSHDIALLSPAFDSAR